jgi:hypothetical protein
MLRISWQRFSQHDRIDSPVNEKIDDQLERTSLVCPTCQSGLASALELFMYACKVKETANGSRSCACGEARQAFEVVA